MNKVGENTATSFVYSKYSNFICLFIQVEMQPGSRKTSKMESFATIVNG